MRILLFSIESPVRDLYFCQTVRIGKEGVKLSVFVCIAWSGETMQVIVIDLQSLQIVCGKNVYFFRVGFFCVLLDLFNIAGP